MKENNSMLQMEFDRLVGKLRQVAELEEKIEHLQAGIDAKNIMLDDKN